MQKATTSDGVLVDLSKASHTELELIFYQLPSRTLVKVCTSVSKRWHSLLLSAHFWVEKMRIDGYRLPQEFITGVLLGHNLRLPVGVVSRIAVERPFQRNFVQDEWKVGVGSGSDGGLEFHGDRRWTGIMAQQNQATILKGVTDSDTAWLNERGFVAEVPPLFLHNHWAPDQQNSHPEIVGCLATSYSGPLNTTKRIVIRLLDEGLTPEILKTVRPTIVVSELFAHRADCSSVYAFECELLSRKPSLTGRVGKGCVIYVQKFEVDFDRFISELRTTGRQSNAVERSVEPERCSLITVRTQWQEQRWEEARFEFRDYPPTVQYLVVSSSGQDTQSWRGHYGAKMTKCRVEVLADSNAPPKEDPVNESSSSSGDGDGNKKEQSCGVS